MLAVVLAVVVARRSTVRLFEFCVIGDSAAQRAGRHYGPSTRLPGTLTPPPGIGDPMPAQKGLKALWVRRRAARVCTGSGTRLNGDRADDSVCDYCGCLALDAIAALTAEHDLVVNLAGDARRALRNGDLDLAADRARAVTAVLAPHTVVEERGLFPAMAGEYGDHVSGLLDEHRRVESVLAESVDVTPTDPGWPARLEDALSLLREHILKEQDGVFPAALALLDPVQWDSIDAVRARVGSGLPTKVAG